MKKITRSLFALLCLAVATALAASVPMARAGTPEQNRAVGFSDACNHVPMTGHHTNAYIDGYNAGLAQCGSQAGATPVGPSSGSGSGSSSSSSSSSNGNVLNIHIDGAK